jgi:carbonic anhydrase
MNRRIRAVLTTALLVSPTAFGAAGAHWGYTGHAGPEHWGELEPAYALCASGKNQSPVDLTGFVEADLKPISLDYHGSATEILNNGHTVQANFGAGDTITVDGRAFVLKQIHFHTPSENHIDGQAFPLEAHFVHRDDQGNLAVIAVMFKEGKENLAIAKLWRQMPEKADERAALVSKFVAAELLPASRDHYRFNGSLTTPPCSEGVLWMVMKESVTISREQVERFARVIHHANNRPVQPLNARAVLR